MIMCSYALELWHATCNAMMLCIVLCNASICNDHVVLWHTAPLTPPVLTRHEVSILLSPPPRPLGLGRDMRHKRVGGSRLVASPALSMLVLVVEPPPRREGTG